MLALSTALAACTQEDTQEEGKDDRKPNVVLVVLDTVRADHLGVYGYPWNTSPNLDALAREGVVYERAISPSPWTVPAIGSILTSRYPSEHHAGQRSVDAPSGGEAVHVNWSTLGKMDATLPSIASLLGERGWKSYAVLANPALRGFGLFSDSYEHVDDTPGILHRPAARITDAALSILENSSDDPLFLVLHYIDPHAPYDPRGVVSEDTIRQYAQRAGLSLSRSRAVANYDQEIRDMDSEIGRLLDWMRAKDQYRDALIIVIADHGEELWDRDQREQVNGATVTTPLGHGHTFFQELLHVPFIIKYPSAGRSGGEPQGKRDAQLVSSMDVLPTILDVAGLDVSGQLRGVSLAEPDSATRDSRSVISEHPIYLDDRKAVVQGMLKYIRSTKTGAERFMSLASKKFRDREVSQELPEADKQRMRGLMEQALTGEGSAAGEVVDQGTLEKMRALGYVE